MSAQTTFCIAARLPDCLTTIVIDYFGWLPNIRTSYDVCVAAQRGQYEDCENVLPDEMNSVFAGACIDANIQIIRLAMVNGINSWNVGMSIASQYGHIDVVKLMITHGADNWNTCLCIAYVNNRHTIAKLMIKHGASDWVSCRNAEIILGRKNLSAFMAKCGVSIQLPLSK